MLLALAVVVSTCQTHTADDPGLDSAADDRVASASALAALQDSDPPIAEAGANRTYYEGAFATLNGSESLDDMLRNLKG